MAHSRCDVQKSQKPKMIEGILISKTNTTSARLHYRLPTDFMWAQVAKTASQGKQFEMSRKRKQKDKAEKEVGPKKERQKKRQRANRKEQTPS